MKKVTLLIIATLAALSANPVNAATFYSEDFESYDFDADVSGPGLWTISDTSSSVEPESTWHLVDTYNAAVLLGLLPAANPTFGPGTVGGTSTPKYGTPPGTHTPSGDLIGGRYLISTADYDNVPENTFPTFTAGLPEDYIANSTYSGASHDLISPSFDPSANSGNNSWLHTSVSAVLNDDGQAIFDIDISTDGGATWVNKFRRIGPGTGRNIASADFDADQDVDGIDFLAQQRDANFSDCLNCGPDGTPSITPRQLDTNRRDTAQRLSDWKNSYQGAYTPLVATTAAKNAGGHQGEVDLNLGDLGGATDVKVRFRHFEQRDDYHVAIDNVVVDDMPAAGSESAPIFFEDFNDLVNPGSGGQGLGQMAAYEYTDPLTPFVGIDSGDGGTRSGHSWGAQDHTVTNDDNTDRYANGRYDVGVVQGRGVNHLGHPTPEGPNGEVPFAIIDSEGSSEPGPQFSGAFQSERLHTPILNLSGHSTVILEWDDENIFSGDPGVGSVMSVALVQDDGDGIPNNSDTELNYPVGKATFADPYEPYTIYDPFAGQLISGGNDLAFGHHRIDISLDAAGTDDLYVAFQFRSTRAGVWAVDNVRITGDGVPLLAAVSTPEPTSLLLALVGLPVICARRRRRRIG